jgi:hypothetical protein
VNETQLKYHPLNVTLHFFIGLFFFGLMATILIQTPNKLAGIVFMTILMLLAGPVNLSFIKCFLRMLNKKSPLILTNEYYIDNINNIKIKWQEITNVGSANIGQWTFLTFNLTDNSIFFRQIKNPIYNLLFRLEYLLTKTSLKTNTTFILGDKPAANSTYPKGGVSCFADSLAQAESSVLRMKFSGKCPALRVAAKR